VRGKACSGDPPFFSPPFGEFDGERPRPSKRRVAPDAWRFMRRPGGVVERSWGCSPLGPHSASVPVGRGEAQHVVGRVDLPSRRGLACGLTSILPACPSAPTGRSWPRPSPTCASAPPPSSSGSEAAAGCCRCRAARPQSPPQSPRAVPPGGPRCARATAAACSRHGSSRGATAANGDGGVQQPVSQRCIVCASM